MFVSGVPAKPSLLTSFRTQLAVIHALTIREGQANHTTKTLGFFWIIGEPLILICGVMAAWSIRGRDAGHLGVNVTIMAITAYTHVQLWRRSVLPSLNLIHVNQSLFFHRNVHPLDLILAHTLIEAIGIFAAFVIVMSVALLIGAVEPVRDPGLMLAGWSMDILWCFSVSVLCAGISGLSELFERIMHPLMYLTLPICGAFTLADWVPPKYRLVLEWVGLANCAEMFRAGVFSLSVKTYWSVSVIVFESLGFLVIGLPILEHARRKMEVTHV
jgi:capsular polysaccharide transport system permease protein